jgi:hypothetical protein
MYNEVIGWLQQHTHIKVIFILNQLSDPNTVYGRMKKREEV